MINHALQFYMHEGPAVFRIELAGHLNEEGARRLDREWRTAASIIGDRRRIVDMTFVTIVDEHGRALMGRWHREGTRFIANSEASFALAESVLGEDPMKPCAEAGATAVEEHTWRPLMISSLVRAVALSFLVTLPIPRGSHAATPNSETSAAWQSYVPRADANFLNARNSRSVLNSERRRAGNESLHGIAASANRGVVPLRGGIVERKRKGK